MTPIQVTAAGFDADGVRLTSPAAAGFDSWIDALGDPRYAQTLKDAKRSIVIVSNESARKIVALSTVFSVTGGRRGGRNSVFFVAPDAIADEDIAYGRSSERGIPPGRQKMIGFNFAVPCRGDLQQALPEDRAREEEEFAFYFPQVCNWIESVAEELSSARQIHITLDAVIFDDGLMLGEDCSGLGPHFAALVQARQDAYRMVLQRIEEGQQPGDAVKACLRPDRTERPDRFDREWLVSNEAKNTVAALLRHYGRAQLPDILRRALLPQPFTIRRG